MSDEILKLRMNRTFTSLSLSERGDVLRALKPIARETFSAKQRTELSTMWMAVSQPQLDQMNAVLLPEHRLIPAKRTKKGALVINAKFLTDCFEPGDTYYSVRHELALLSVLTLQPEDFPNDNATGDSEQGSDEDRRREGFDREPEHHFSSVRRERDNLDSGPGGRE